MSFDDNYYEVIYFLKLLYNMNFKVNVFSQQHKNQKEQIFCSIFLTYITEIYRRMPADIRKSTHFDSTANLNIEIICKKINNDDDILLDKSNMLTNRHVKITCYYKDNLIEHFKLFKMIKDWNARMTRPPAGKAWFLHYVK